MQSVSSRIWTRVTMSISYNDNNYTTGTSSKSYITPLFELTLDNIVFIYCLLETTCFIYAKESFIGVTNLRDRRMFTPDISAQLKQCREKICQHPLWEEDSMKSAYMAELLSRNHCEERKAMSNSPVGQGGLLTV